MYKLDRTAFKAHTVAEADNHDSYYKQKTWQERLRIVIYLNSVVYKIIGNAEPRLDRNIFSAKSNNS